MQVYKYYPVANDRMGTIWTLCSIKGACIIEFGPAGTTHYAIEGIGSLNGEEGAKIYSTHMDESDVTFGKYDRLENAILEIDENLKPKYIFVMASSISSIIGADIISVCTMLKDKTSAKLIPITTGGLKDDYNIGVENTLELLVKELVLKNEPDKNKYNIIGSNIDKYNFSSDLEEIKRMMKEIFNKDVNTVFTCDSSIESLENAAKASLNIIIRKEGLKAAEIMKKEHNIPYVYANLYGLKNTIDFINEVTKIDGYVIDENKLKSEIDNVNKHMFTLKRKFYFNEEIRKCAIFGDYDTVLGFKALIEEINLEVDRAEVLYREVVEDNILSRCSELERIKYLKENELLLLLGDGPSLDMDNKAKSSLQISNPNLNQINIYSYTPYIGFRGCLNIYEKILNIHF